MTAQTEPAVLSAEMAAEVAAYLQQDIVRIQGRIPRESELKPTAHALMAIIDGTVICKSSAAEAADRARIAELETRLRDALQMCNEAELEIDNLEEQLSVFKGPK